MQTKLYRSRSNSVIAGVCGGLGDYLGIDPVLVRIFFLLFVFAGGAGPLIYLLLWLIIPLEDSTYSPNDLGGRVNQVRDEFIQVTNRPNPSAAKWIGFGLVGLGVLFLLQALNLPFLGWLDEDVLWPVLLVVAGLVLLYRAMRGRNI
ncbi:MAG TPA: PspC domain-containing protein [Anaerolineaceae bacterium]